MEYIIVQKVLFSEIDNVLCILYHFILPTYLESTTKIGTAASLDDLFAHQPPILEIATHARTAKWNHLGVILQLDDECLAGCHDYISMYQLWIQEKADAATRSNLLHALRAIGQNNVAYNYEEYVKSLTVS